MPPPDRGPASGRDLLDARALWASIVGPQRFAMGAKQSFLLKAGEEAKKIGDNIAASGGYVLLGVEMVGIGLNPGIPAFIVFSKDDTIGAGSGFPHMFGIFGASPPPSPFTQLLLPGEQLFAQIEATAFGTTEARIVVSQVTF